MAKPTKETLLWLHRTRTGDKRTTEGLRNMAEAERMWLERAGPRIARIRNKIQSDGLGEALERYDDALEHLLQDDPREYSAQEVIDRLNALERQAMEEIDRMARKADLIEFEQLESGYRIHQEMQRKPARRRKGMFMDRMFE